MEKEKLVKKFMVALFIEDDEGNDTRISKSTAFDLAMNPTVNERNYIADQHPTKEVDGYSPSLSQPIVMYKGSPDYNVAFPMAFNMRIGANARRRVLVVFMQEKTVLEPVYSEVSIEEGDFVQGRYYVKNGDEYEFADEFDGSATYYQLTAGRTVYKAWKTDATLSVTNINTVDSTITVDVNFGGTIDKGIVEAVAKKPVFTKTEDDDGDFIDPFI